MAGPSSPATGPDLAALLARIDDDPDPLHLDSTPAATALAAAGRPALPGLLALMAAPQPHTRMRAQRAFEGVLLRELGFVPGQGFATREGEQRLRDLWAAHGGYAWDAPEPVRASAIAAWQAWLAS
jgi:hypothetical protein